MSDRSAAKTKDTKAKHGSVEEAAAEIPPELLRRDRNVRYERGGAVYATDGRVGLLKQVVVDDTAGEVQELIMEVDGPEPRTVLLPPDLVDKTAGSAVFLTINRVQFAERAASAPVYEKKGFARADVKLLLKNGEAARDRNPRRAVIVAGRDHLETPTVSLLDWLDRRQAVPADGTA